LDEEATGKYDWDAIATAAVAAKGGKVSFDVADYFGPAEIPPVPEMGWKGMGLGTFAWRTTRRDRSPW
jgi:hypothetical protein